MMVKTCSMVNQCDGDLMRALQLSQTRAREAEKRASEANMDEAARCAAVGEATRDGGFINEAVCGSRGRGR